jgi:hypothetical protein
MMRRGRSLAARWNAASEAARRWRIALSTRSSEGTSGDPEREEKKPDPEPRRTRRKGGKRGEAS